MQHGCRTFCAIRISPGGMAGRVEKKWKREKQNKKLESNSELKGMPELFKTFCPIKTISTMYRLERGTEHKMEQKFEWNKQVLL